VRTWLLTIALFFAFAAQANAYIYWTDGNAGTIGRANLDGSGVKAGFITGATEPRGIAVHADHIYWANAGSIGRADLDGSDVDQDFITAAAVGLAVDGSHVYWTTPTGIGRAGLDGSNVDGSFITGEQAPVGLAVNSLNLYWSAGGAIRRADLNGTGVSTVAASAQAGGLAVDASQIVWASPTAVRADDLPSIGAGTAMHAVAARAVELDGNHFYWTTGNAIGRINRNASGLDANFIALTGADPQGLAVRSGTASPSATSLSFGFEAVGALGAGRTLTVANTGRDELVIDLARITGTHLDDFLLGRDTCSGGRLALGATCEVSVVFVPDAIGDRTASLTLTSDDPASPLKIPLQGTGEDPSPPGSFDDDSGFDETTSGSTTTSTRRTRRRRTRRTGRASSPAGSSRSGSAAARSSAAAAATAACAAPRTSPRSAPPTRR
jgi:hypothetical protein